MSCAETRVDALVTNCGETALWHRYRQVNTRPAYAGVFVFEAETLRFSSVNRGTAERFGYTPSELANMTPPDILPAFDETSLREMLSPLFSGDSPTRISATVLRCKDGTDVPVEVAFQTLTGVSAPQPLVALVCTVAKRRDAEAGLHERSDNLDRQVAERTAELRESERRTVCSSITCVAWLTAAATTGTGQWSCERGLPRFVRYLARRSRHRQGHP